MRSWINQFGDIMAKEAADVIEALMEWLVDPCYDFVRKNCKVGTTTLNALLNLSVFLWGRL